MKNIVYICDLDGTLVKKSLTLDFYQWLEQFKIVPQNSDLKKWNSEYKSAELMSKLSVDFQKAITGYSIESLKNAFSQFLNTYASDKNNFTKAFSMIDKDSTIVISGSPDFLVDMFCQKVGIAYGFGADLYIRHDVITGICNHLYYKEAKAMLLKDMEDRGFLKLSEYYVIGVGDTKGDAAICDASSEFWLNNPSIETVEFFTQNYDIKNIKIIQ